MSTFLNWIWERLNYLNTEEGLHHVAHFFIAGWIAHIAGLGVVIIVAIGREIYDLLREQNNKEEENWRDHFWDIISWVSGALVWIYLFLPICGVFLI